MTDLQPYYSSDQVTLYCGDAREILPQLETESADATITDPPYGKEWRSNTRRERFDAIEGDGATEAVGLLGSVVNDIVRTTRRTRHIYTFGLPLQHRLLTVKAELVWDKGRMGSGDLTCAWAPSHEPIFFHVRAADKTNADRMSGALAARLRRGSVISVKRLSALQVKRHPTEKPVALMRQLIEASTMPSETVLDPFAGVGSTLVAALLEGRKAVGIEVDPRYCEIAAQRLMDAESILSKLEAA